MDHWPIHLLCHTPYRPWLTDNGSLTLALKRRCAALRVIRLRQARAKPNYDELQPLGLTAGRLAVIREVLLVCGGRPLVYAHSVIPEAGIRGPWRSLSSLGNKPLGEALFADPLVERHPLSFKRLDRRHPLYHGAHRHLAESSRYLWARRSVFALDEHPILVTEVFLPEVLRLPPPHTVARGKR